MATNNDFTPHGYYCISNWGGYLIQVSADGSMARFAQDYGNGTQDVTTWREIRFTKGGSPYCRAYSTTLYLDNFLRI